MRDFFDDAGRRTLARRCYELESRLVEIIRALNDVDAEIAVGQLEILAKARRRPSVEQELFGRPQGFSSGPRQYSHGDEAHRVFGRSFRLDRHRQSRTRGRTGDSEREVAE
jgi:hypothetical protein